MAEAESISRYLPGLSARQAGEMFDGIAPAYDILNHILSLGQDFLWRRKLADSLDKKQKLRVLDLATGTGDSLISLLRRNPNIIEATGLDISENMLALCRKKIARRNLAERVNLVCAEVTANPFAGESFDVVTMSFGIRNTPNPFETLIEIRRLLRPGGTALILEFSMPKNKILKNFHRLYLNCLVPLIGRLFSGNVHAYRYLSTSIENFAGVEDFSRMVLDAGFSHVHATSLTFGVACIYRCYKPACQ